MLRIDYSSSDEEVDDSDRQTLSSDETKVDIRCAESPTKSMANPFDANNFELSSSEDEDKQESIGSVVLKSNAVKSSSAKNQLIDSNLQNSIHCQSKVSIFSNPFKDEQMKQLEPLERHVKMSDNKQMTTTEEDHKSSKAIICWSYHKHKKCRFGNRCRFQHKDNDFLDIKQKSDPKNPKKVGITDSLIPPKRSLKAYYKQQNTI